MQDRLFAKENIEVLWDSEVQEFYGDDEVDYKKLRYVLIKNNFINIMYIYII